MNTIRPYAPLLWTVAILLIAHAQPARAQQSGRTGSLTLAVTDAEERQPLVGYTASLTPNSLGSSILCSPDYNGRAYFRSIPAGLYRLKVSYVGYFPEVIDSLMIHADSAVTISLQLHLYNGLTEFDATEDLAKGIVRLYRSEWFSGPGSDLSSKYGFRIELKCCDPTFKFDRYNAVVYKYLDRLNGPGWYDKYLRDLWHAKVASDSINNRSNK